MCNVTLSGFGGVFPLLAPMLGDVTAANLATAKKHFWDGKRAFNSGDYKTAGKEFQKAHDLSKKPGLLYNLGVTEAKLGKLASATLSRGDRHIQCLEAICFFKKYLKTNPDSPWKERADEYVEVIGKKKEKDGADDEPDIWSDPYNNLNSDLIDVFPEEVAPTEPDEVPFPPEDQPGTDGEDEYIDEAGGSIDLKGEIDMQTDRGSYGWLKWTSAGLAVASFTAAVISDRLARMKADEHGDVVGRAASERKIAGENGNRYFVDAEAEGEYRGKLNELDRAIERRVNVARISAIGGAVLSVAAGVFFWLDHGQPRNDDQARLDFELFEGGGRVTVGVEF